MQANLIRSTVGVDSAEVKAWIDSIGTDHELPVPYSGR